MAALAALGVLVVGLIALHFWLAPQIGSLGALGMIGAGLLSLTLILLLVAFARRRPELKTRPAVLVARPVALFRTPANLSTDQAITGQGSPRLASDTLLGRNRPELLGALALFALVGVIAGRRLRRLRE
jgi:hypothetical protein